jgi:hypothetical protein
VTIEDRRVLGAILRTRRTDAEGQREWTRQIRRSLGCCCGNIESNRVCLRKTWWSGRAAA